MVAAVDLGYPFEGRWLTRNSPASRVPSHGTTLWASSFAIDGASISGRVPLTRMNGTLLSRRW